MSLLPADVAETLPAEPGGLFELVWTQLPVELVPAEVTFVDCGTLSGLERARALAG
jgi:hypothetical protein